MDNKKAGFTSVDDYIATFPEDVQARLQELRATIKAAAPDAAEKISYQMPAFALHGNLVYFAAWKKHIGFYPISATLEAFRDELAPYKMSKGAIQFPYDQPLPLELISKIVKFRVDENVQKAATKSRKKE